MCSSQVIVALLKKFKVADNPRKFALFECYQEEDNHSKRDIYSDFIKLSDQKCYPIQSHLTYSTLLLTVWLLHTRSNHLKLPKKPSWCCIFVFSQWFFVGCLTLSSLWFSGCFGVEATSDIISHSRRMKQETLL